MIPVLPLLGLLMLPTGTAGAQGPQDATLLGCSFGAPGEELSANASSHKLYLLDRLDARGNEAISVIDPDSMLAGTTLKYRKIRTVEGGEVWTFSESATEPTGTILFVLPKATVLKSGREARAASLGQYHGSGPRNGVCVIAHGQEAIATFDEFSTGSGK